MATPTTCKPSGPYCFCSSTNQGISILQGAHQVAQKLSNTAWPRKSDSRMVLPSSVCRVKSGATSPLACGPGTEVPFDLRAMLDPNTSIRATTMATTMMTTGSRFKGRLPTTGQSDLEKKDNSK